MHGSATQGSNFHQVLLSGIRIDVPLFPERAAIVKAMTAVGSTKIIGNQSAGSQFFDNEVSHLDSVPTLLNLKVLENPKHQ
jgi:hypothetical protein